MLAAAAAAASDAIESHILSHPYDNRCKLIACTPHHRKSGDDSIVSLVLYFFKECSA
jgi:hypothetical protein